MSNQNQNIFFEHVSKNLETKNEKFQQIFKSINENFNFPINLDNGELDLNLPLGFFEAFGTYSYIAGNFKDLIAQKILGLKFNENSEKTIKTLNDRLIKLNVSTENFNSYLYALSNVCQNAAGEENEKYAKIIIAYFNKEKELMKDKIKLPVKFNAPTLIKIKNLLFKSGLCVDVEYAEALFNLKQKIDKNDLIMHDLIIINSLIYEKSSFVNTGDKKLIIELISDPDYRTNLDLANEYFQLQKYALLYFETSVTMMEKLSIVANPDHVTIDNIKSKDETFGISKQLNEKAEDKSKFKHKTYSINHNESIHTYLFKTFNNVGVENLERDADYPLILKRAIEIIKDSDFKDQIANMLMTGIKTETDNTDRLAWKKSIIMGSLSILEREMNDKNIEFETKVKEYVKNIPTNKKETIVSLIDNLIELLIVSVDAEASTKGLVLEQLVENKIHTYKQLNQFIEVLESCQIKTQHVEEYSNFMQFIRADKTISDKLMLSIECNKIQNDQQYLLMFIKYLRHLQK